MSTTADRRSVWVVTLLSLVVVVQVTRIWAGRLLHPYDLEWMEGGMLAHAWRASKGLPLYPEPTAEFVPFVYPPLYPQLLSWISVDYSAGRALSVLGAMGATFAVMGLVRNDGGRWATAFGAAAVFLGTYPSSGAFFDLVRPDSLSLGLLAWSVVLGLKSGPRWAAASGGLLFAAFAAKQSAAVVGVPMALALLLRSRRDGAAFVAASLLPALAFVGWEQSITHGRFVDYLVWVPAAHPTIGGRAWPGLPRELGQHLAVPLFGASFWWYARPNRAIKADLVAIGLPAFAGVAVAVVGLATPVGSAVPFVPEGWAAVGFFAFGATAMALCLELGVRVVKRGPDVSWRWVYGTGVVVVLVLMAGWMRSHHGGYVNVYMPAHWVICTAFGLAMSRWERTNHVAGPLVALLISAQLVVLAARLHDTDLIPTVEDWKAGDQVIGKLHGVKGPVLAPWSSWLPAQAGHAPSVHWIAWSDIDHPNSPFQQQASRMRLDVGLGYWKTAVLGEEDVGFGVEDHFTRTKPLPVGEAMWTRSGWPARPNRIGLPK